MAELRAARKTYTTSELGVWFARVLENWEDGFSDEEISAGRALYTSGGVRALDLRREEALIGARLEGGEEPYCIIDYDGGNFSYRGSDSNRLLSAAIAVAGLYEIEELVAEETAPYATLDVFENAPEKPPAAEEGASEERDAESKAAAPAPADGAKPAMRMELAFSVKKDALVFSAHWENSKRVFGENSLDAAALNSAERESIIRLMTFARRSNFKYEGGVFRLRDISQMPKFVSKTLAQWAAPFAIKKGEDVDLLARGETGVEIRSRAEECAQDASAFEVSWEAKIAGRGAEGAALARLFGSGGAARILPGRGIVKISEEDEIFIRQMERARELSKGKIPRYMLMTLFGMPQNIALSPKLSKWKKGMLAGAGRAEEGELERLPEFLRHYQKLGVAWLEKIFSFGCGALLADEMGLGKTVQSLCAISKLWDGKRNFIIVCPASVIPVWISEAARFFPEMRTHTLSSSAREFDGGTLCVSSYTQLRRNKDFLEGKEFALAVLDEAQSIKNPESKTTAACMAIRAKRKLALTGTPLENRVMDLWTIFRWLMPGLMGSHAAFERFMEADVSAVETVRRQISPFMLRRLKSEVASELPEKIYIDLACPMTDMQKLEYDRLLSQARGVLGAHAENARDERRNRISILSLLTRLRQISCDAALLPWLDSEDHLSSGKISVLLDRVEELSLGGKRILVFSQFTSFLDRIKKFASERCPELPIYELTGKTRDRAAPVGAFQSSKKSALMLVSLRAGGTGITLTNADYVFFMDPWWNPAVEEQAIDRVHRIGRKGDVFIYRMVAESTVEERVRKLQIKKKRLFDDIFSGLSDVSKGDNFFETVSQLLQ